MCSGVMPNMFLSARWETAFFCPCASSALSYTSVCLLSVSQRCRPRCSDPQTLLRTWVLQFAALNISASLLMTG